VSPAELRRRLEEYWNLPARYLDCRFENFDAHNQALEGRLCLAKRVAAERRSALIFGRPGVGKSHLAVAIMADWIDRGARGRFVGALEYGLQVQASYGNPKEIVDDLLEDANFLLLDDLGTERDNETARIAILYLIDQLYCKRRRVIVTSNLTPAELSQFEPRIVSRLTEMGTLIEVKAEDYRIRMAAHRRKSERIDIASSIVN
jgi:DNA replication protein DnaC